MTRLVSTSAGERLSMDLLQADIRHYDWGDEAFIADLQGRPPSGQPEAELWMGAHPGAPSRLAVDGRTLDEAIEADPLTTLGDAAAGRFGALPFLAKVLAAAQPLSIQTHPSSAQAREGFDREEASGMPRDHPRRIYRDPNHKPELMYALTSFEAKCGLRNLDATRELVAAMLGHGAPAMSELADRLAAGGSDRAVLADVLRWLLGLDRSAAAPLVRSVVAAAANVVDGPFAPDFRWVAPMAQRFPDDSGVVVALLLNHVELAPGEAVFLGAGNLHAYLHGAGIEVMANSDNVVRGGLTTKHIDIDELLHVADTTPFEPVIQVARGDRHRFDCPVADFSLERIVIDTSLVIEPEGPEILLVTAGEIEVTRPQDAAGSGPFAVAPGMSVWLPATGGHVRIDGRGMVFRVGMGGGSAVGSTIH